MEEDNPTKKEEKSSDASSIETIRTSMRKIANRQWWLWGTAVTVVFFLVLGIVSFAFSGVVSEQSDSEWYRTNLNLSIRSLVGLILLFGLFIIYHQFQTHKIEAKVGQQITILGEAQQDAAKSSGRDNITGFFNRNFGQQRLLEEMARSQRNNKRLSILRVDLDAVRNIDNKLGPALGNQAIQLFAEHLKSNIRVIDVAIHRDRGEFLVLLPECGVSAEEIVSRINQVRFALGDKDKTEFAAGWADYVKGEPPHALLFRAESMLQSNKQSVDDASDIEQITVSGFDDPVATLTTREREVLKLLAAGKSNKEIASCLNIALRTAENHRHRLMVRLNIHSEGGLIRFAIRNKIIPA
jgi:diguanylate cyclase (GGDEF)-like protein